MTVVPIFITKNVENFVHNFFRVVCFRYKNKLFLPQRFLQQVLAKTKSFYYIVFTKTYSYER